MTLGAMNAAQSAEEMINAMNAHDLERMAAILTVDAVGDDAEIAVPM
jgi:hypothetical protein